mgnify:CR=1 FL=1
MRVVFLGTPEFAVPVLEKIAERHQVVAVVTQCDKLGNRCRLAPSPVKVRATEMGLDIFQFQNLSRDGAETLRRLKPGVLVTAAYGQILSEEILSVAPNGVLNVHASLLPCYRGAAPINWVLINGETETGVTIMRTVKKLDAGDVLLTDKIGLDGDINAGELTEKLSLLSADLIIRALELVENGNAVFTPQDETKATFCKKLRSETEIIDWSKNSIQIHNLIRGLSPVPSARTTLRGKHLKILRSSVAPPTIKTQGATAGEVIACGKSGIIVACGSGALVLETVLYEGGKAVSCADFANGRKIAFGDRLE